MLFSTATFLSLLAVLPFTLANPTPVQERNPDKPKYSQAPLKIIDFFENPTCTGNPNTVQLLATFATDMKPGCQTIPIKGAYFRTDMTESPVKEGRNHVLYATDDCSGPETRLSLFKVHDCNEAQDEDGKPMTVKSVFAYRGQGLDAQWRKHEG